MDAIEAIPIDPVTLCELPKEEKRVTEGKETADLEDRRRELVKAGLDQRYIDYALDKRLGEAAIDARLFEIAYEEQNAGTVVRAAEVLKNSRDKREVARGVGEGIAVNFNFDLSKLP